MVSNEDVIAWLKENRTNAAGNIDLQELDLGDLNIVLSGITTTGFIANNNQKGRSIWNEDQEATWNIKNSRQISGEMIMNNNQIGKTIANVSQIATTSIENSFQCCKNMITNIKQKSNKIKN